MQCLHRKIECQYATLAKFKHCKHQTYPNHKLKCSQTLSNSTVSVATECFAHTSSLYAYKYTYFSQLFTIFTIFSLYYQKLCFLANILYSQNWNTIFIHVHFIQMYQQAVLFWCTSWLCVSLISLSESSFACGEFLPNSAGNDSNPQLLWAWCTAATSSGPRLRAITAPLPLLANCSQNCSPTAYTATSMTDSYLH